MDKDKTFKNKLYKNQSFPASKDCLYLVKSPLNFLSLPSLIYQIS